MITSDGWDLDEPRFDNAGRVHDWRNYVPDSVKEIWNELPALGKVAVYHTAKEMANKEEWD